MDKHYRASLAWTEQQTARLLKMIKEWSSINTGSDNLAGLAQFSQLLKRAFETLGADVQELTLPPREIIDEKGDLIRLPVGKMLLCTKRRKQSKISVLLGGHMDTVYSLNSAFQSCMQIDAHRLRGPGVADMKGGLALMLIALETLERSPFADQLSWEVFINPDEEIGSPSSTARIRALASNHRFGLLFEPLLPDGSFVSARKGSANFSVVARGRSAHVGRDLEKGRNAIAALVPLLVTLLPLHAPEQGMILNLGSISGGGPVNIVPALAILRFGLRAHSAEALQQTVSQIQTLIDQFSHTQEGLSLSLHQDSYRPPKPFDRETERLFQCVKACADALSLPTHWTETGGVCDGNTLASAGLPTIDTLGVEGGKLHTEEEFIRVDSLSARGQLAALILLRLATGEFETCIP